MKSLLNKKLTGLISVGVLFFTITNGQMHNHFLPSRKPGFNYSKANKQFSTAGFGYDTRLDNKVPCLKKQNTLGGSGNDVGAKLISTRDGGFIVCGGTDSGDGNFKVPAANEGDAFIAKYNRFRQLEWTKTLGGTGDDYFNGIIQTFDGGYVATGQSNSSDGNVSGNHGGYDVFVVKFTASGNIEWQKSFGGSGDDFGNGIIQTFYGSYAIVGFTNSTDGNVSGQHGTDGDFDAWLIQLGPKGNLLSQHCYGGTGFDDFLDLVSSDEGSLIMEGVTQSNDGDVSGNHGGNGGDAWVIKINAHGKIIWQKTIGGTSDDEPGNAMAKTRDGNIVIDGYSSSVDGDIKAQDSIASFVTKLNSFTGNIIWSKSYAAPRLRAGFGIFATKDGGAVETGAIGTSFDNVTFDVLISKFDGNGNEEWYKRLGGTTYDASANGGYESLNGDLNIMGVTTSTDGDIKKSDGEIDTWLIKLGRCGEEDEDQLPVAVSQNNAISNFKNNTVSLSSYPNPFSGSTNISFSIPQSQKVFIQVFDGAGRLIKTIADEQMQAGAHQLTWNAAGVAKGIYYLKFNAGNYAETKKLSVLK